MLFHFLRARKDLLFANVSTGKKYFALIKGHFTRYRQRSLPGCRRDNWLSETHGSLLRDIFIQVFSLCGRHLICVKSTSIRSKTHSMTDCRIMKLHTSLGDDKRGFTDLIAQIFIQISRMSQQVSWVRLLDLDGNEYKATSVSKVSLSSAAYVDDFLRAVKTENINKLSSFSIAELKVYKNKEEYEAQKESMKGNSAIKGLGATESLALIVVVPPLFKFVKEPHPKRKERWILLNKMLEENARRAKALKLEEDSDSD